MNAAKTISTGKWEVKQNTALSSLTIGENASLAAPEGKALTMTVNGVGIPIKPGTYKGDILITVTDSLLIAPGGLYRKEKPKEYRTAIFIDNGKYVGNKSVSAVVQGGKVTDKAATGVTIYSTEESFNGIFITGDSEYTIDGLKIDFEGDGTNDFIGLGAGIMCTGNAKVTINDSDIKLKGVTRAALHAGGSSVITVNNCRLSNESPETKKMAPLWALGLSGTNRATQLCDNATIYYNNCYLNSNGWGTMSIDGGIRVRMYLKDSTLKLTGPRARGYGAFSIGDAFVSFDHCVCDVQGYPLLLGGHEKSNGEITGGSVVNSTLYGVLIFREKNCELKVDKSSVINSASSTFVVKGANTFITMDNAKLNPGNGVILQLMDNDEPGMGPSRFIVPIGSDVIIPGRNLAAADPAEDVFLTVSNMEVTGDFYNSTTNLKANCVEKVYTGMMAGMQAMESGEPGDGPRTNNEAEQGVKNLDLKFANAKVTGIISAAKAAYKEGIAVIDAGNCTELSAVKQTAHEALNNGVIVSLDKKSTWSVTGTSYLTSLTVADGAVIKAPKGKKLIMTVDGEKTKIIPGNYTGKIVLEIA